MVLRRLKTGQNSSPLNIDVRGAMAGVGAKLELVVAVVRALDADAVARLTDFS